MSGDGYSMAILSDHRSTAYSQRFFKFMTALGVKRGEALPGSRYLINEQTYVCSI